MGARPWPAIAAARVDAGGRLPFLFGHVRVGSIAPQELDFIADATRGTRGWAVATSAVVLDAPVAARDELLAEADAVLRQAGRIRAWRDEPYPVFDPRSGVPLARMERAAARLWGTLTLGAHATGWVAGADGRPRQLWIAERSATKTTDPGALDNLVGGGVPAGQTAWQALLREGWEEAGLDERTMARAQRGRVIEIVRPVAEGWQWEWLYAFDLRLAPAVEPCNQDGEVAAFHRLPVEAALALAAGDTMTVDASLVTLEFALRHGLLDGAAAAAEAASATLWLAQPAIDSGAPVPPARP